MTQIFVDTSFFKAFIDSKDDFHERSLSLFNRINNEDTELVVTNYIVDETFTLVRIKNGLEKAKKLYKILKDLEGGLKIVRVLVRDEVEAWNWFWKEWRNLSYTDCVSFAVMKRLGIENVATFDRHFSKAGFKVEG